MSGLHWHAYAWNGRERPPDNDRRKPALPLPPMDVGHWLLKPARLRLATYPAPDTGQDAYGWLRAELDAFPRSPRDLPATVQLAYARGCLDRATDVVWGYWSATGLYIARALITCPRADIPCPLRPTEETNPCSDSASRSPTAPAGLWL
ncbi:hypothetical protein C4J65_17195 [Streptomyces sp. CB09001]|uniref:hypothetical protein n=1 Tax=Streptomyces sp. CB09001 TaxID=2083284 RepID=UPI000E215281|nr:hypothetical protein [Streptomyces sp. CB09001]AXL89840.1 hypothetical protein C4J65_17195 [Streptomyces sp. CB09001]